MRIAILGSGPNALAAYRALDGSNHDISVIDFSYNELGGNQQLPGVAGKEHFLAHTSMFIPKIFNTTSAIKDNISGSAAYGGWSNVWGATVFPLTPDEMNSWEIDPEILFEHRYEVCNKLDLFSVSPKTNENFPSVGIAKHIHQLNKTLSSPNIAQISNLALAANSDSSESGCIRCGDCLKGCPWGHIWSSRREWERANQGNHLHLEQNVWIEKIIEVGGQVVVVGERNGKSQEFVFDKVFVALGSYQTVALMLRSGISKEAVIRDSPMFITPFFLPFLRKTTPSRPGVTLSSAFISTRIECSQTKSSEGNFFAQIYGYSEELEEKIVSQVRLARAIPKKLRRFLLSRVGIAMCFFDQSLGGSIKAEFSSNQSVTFSPIEGEHNAWRLSRIARRSLLKFKFMAIPFLGHLTDVGLGYHSGASFPHSKTPPFPGGNYTDYLGRPNGLQNVHIVDISNFPRIGSSPPTFNSMVNAHRIVHQVMNG